MKLFTLIFLFALVPTFFSACKDPSPTQPPPPSVSELIPLKVGNWWAMHTTVTRENVRIYESIDTALINTTVSWDGDIWYGNLTSNYFRRNTSDGVRELYRYPTGDSGRVVLIYKFPASVGDSWMIMPDSITYSVVSINETITVLTETYTGCYRYRYQTSSGEVGYETFSPDIGQVLSEASFDNSGIITTVRSELMAYYKYPN